MGMVIFLLEIESMREKQLPNFCSFSAKLTNSKYECQKKDLGMQLKYFRDYFNYNRMPDFLEDPDKESISRLT
jgi:hypothetical protein